MELNARDFIFGQTGLMIALICKHTAVATMLVQHPAVDVNITDSLTTILALPCIMHQGMMRTVTALP